MRKLFSKKTRDSRDHSPQYERLNQELISFSDMKLAKPSQQKEEPYIRSQQKEHSHSEETFSPSRYISLRGYPSPHQRAESGVSGVNSSARFANDVVSLRIDRDISPSKHQETSQEFDRDLSSSAIDLSLFHKRDASANYNRLRASEQQLETSKVMSTFEHASPIVQNINVDDVTGDFKVS